MSAPQTLVVGISPRTHWLAARLNCPHSPTLPASLSGVCVLTDSSVTWQDIQQCQGDFTLLDTSSTWFTHVAHRPKHTQAWFLADGVWAECGVEHGFALCCGGTNSELPPQITAILDQLAPVSGAWLPLNTPTEASFAALLLNVVYHLALRGLLRMSSWQELLALLSEAADPHTCPANKNPLEAQLRVLFTEQFELAAHLKTVCQQFLALPPQKDEETAFIRWVQWLNLALNSLDEARHSLPPHWLIGTDGEPTL